MSATALAKAQRAIDALDVTMALDSIEKGHVSRAHVEAMKEVYPELFASIQGQIRDWAMKRPGERPKLSTQQEVAMSILFDEPVSTLMRPETVRGLQAAYASNEQPEPTSAQPMAPKRPLGAAPPSMASASDRLEQNL